MIFWNPLNIISINTAECCFSNERTVTKMRMPSGFSEMSPIWERLQHGLREEELAHLSKEEQELIAILFKKRLIATFSDNPRSQFADRNLGHVLTYSNTPSSSLTKARAAKVCILGVGGVGSIVLQHLVAFGLTNFVLVDCDKVEKSNLNRQFAYELRDVGKRKVDAAASFVASRVSDATVTTHDVRIDSIDSLEALKLSFVDCIVHCLDTPRQTIDDIVYGFGATRNISVVGAGVGVYEGYWGPFIDPAEGCSFETWKLAHGSAHSGPPNECTARPTPWSFGPTNSLISVKLAHDVIEWLTGRKNILSMGKRVTLRFQDNYASLRPTIYDRNERAT